MKTYHTAKILESIIERSYDGRQSTLASDSGMAASQLSRTIAGKQSASITLVKSILEVLNEQDGQQLIAAFVRDLIPESLRQGILDSEGELKTVPPAPTPPEIRVLRYLEKASKSDPEIREWLKSTGKLWGIIDHPSLKVAESSDGYSTPEKDGKRPTED